jgi:hypothetical protein
MTIENRTARLTILIDPRKKAVFERLCAAEDTTPSQVVRRLIRDAPAALSGTAQVGCSRGHVGASPGTCGLPR